MKYNNDFRYDLAVGQMGEKALAEILSDKLIEVKTDLQTQKTGNVFIEYESRNKPSGIATTQADYWCFKISESQLILIKTIKLKSIARKFYKTHSIVGGDSDTSKGILLPVGELLDFNEENV